MSNISEIAFEQIYEDYYLGQYGDLKVIINIKTGYINATHLCGLANNNNGNRKELYNWKKSDIAEAIMDEVGSALPNGRSELLRVVNGGSGKMLEIRGTYAHPDLIPHIASWASPKFAVKVSKIVNAQLLRDYKESIRIKDQTIDRLENTIADIKHQNNEIIRQNIDQSRQIADQSRQIAELLGYAKDTKYTLDVALDELIETKADVEVSQIMTDELIKDQARAEAKIDIISEKLEIAVDRRVPRDPVNRRNEALAIMKKPGTNEYKVSRCQHRCVRASISNSCEYGYTEMVYYKEDPNAVNIWNRAKKNMPPDVGVVRRAFQITAPDCDRLIEFVRSVENEKTEV